MMPRWAAWRDGFNAWRSAKPSPTSRSLAESLAGLAAIVTGTVLPFYGPLPDALANWPWLLRGLRIAIPLASVAACASIVAMTIRAEGGERQFRFPATDRLLAGVLIPPLLILLLAEANDALPGRAQRLVAGYVCDAAGAPVSGAVSVLDRTRRVISVERAMLDDTGYFATILDRWSPRPAFIQTHGACETKPIAITDGIEGQACSASPFEPPPRDAPKVWSVSCP